jgi:hypothetical protein
MLFQDHWIMLEVKLSEKSSVRPNQRHYVEKFNQMSFATFISPDNEDEILDYLIDLLSK